MLTNECLFGYHDTCSVAQWCECLCHADVADLLEELEAT